MGRVFYRGPKSGACSELRVFTKAKTQDRRYTQRDSKFGFRAGSKPLILAIVNRSILEIYEPVYDRQNEGAFNLAKKSNFESRWI